MKVWTRSLETDNEMNDTLNTKALKQMRTEDKADPDPDLDTEQIGTDEVGDDDDRKMFGLGDQRRLQRNALWLLLPQPVSVDVVLVVGA